MAAPDCSAGFFSQLWSGNAIVCNKTFQEYEVQTEKDAVQSVADNAKEAYGEGSAIANLTQTTATQQEAQVEADVANVTEAISSSTAGQIFTTCDNGGSGIAIPGLPCVNWSYIGIGFGVIVLLYLLAVFAPLISRSR